MVALSLIGIVTAISLGIGTYIVLTISKDMEGY